MNLKLLLSILLFSSLSLASGKEGGGGDPDAVDYMEIVSEMLFEIDVEEMLPENKMANLWHSYNLIVESLNDEDLDDLIEMTSGDIAFINSENSLVIGRAYWKDLSSPADQDEFVFKTFMSYSNIDLSYGRYLHGEFYE